MKQTELRQLFESIKKDDLKSFSSIMISNSDLNISFGRFPILSVCYLYESYNILAKYENLLMPIHNYKIENEYFEIYLTFKSKAKKMTRLFLGDEICYPILMLGVLDNRFLINKYYSKLYKNDEICEKLIKIYNLDKNCEIDCSGDKISIPKKKLNFKQKLCAFLMCFVAVVISIFSLSSIVIIKNSTGIGTASNPIKIASEQEFCSALKSGKRFFSLEKDIVLTSKVNVKNFSGTIFGNSHQITINQNLSKPLIQNFSGEIVDLDFNFDSELNILENLSIIAQNLTGIIKNCVFSGELNLNYLATEDVYVSTIAFENSGLIENCSVNYNVVANNSGLFNCFYSGMSAINKSGGKIVDCKTSGSVSADTVDIAGYVCENYGTIDNCLNNFELTQTTSKEWHPNVAGVAIENFGTISNSKNNANLKSVSTLETAGDTIHVFVGGMCCNNYNHIYSCENYGEINGSSIIAKIYASGICSSSQCNEKESVIENCLSSSDIIVESSTGEVYASGIVSWNYSTIVQDIFMRVYVQKLSSVKHCGFCGSISTNSKTAFAGGIVAYNYYSSVEDCYSNISVSDLSSKDTGFIQAAGAIVSVSWDLSLIKNIHYVKSDGLVAVNSINNYLTGYVIQAVGDIACSATGYDTFDEIPQEILL